MRRTQDDLDNYAIKAASDPSILAHQAQLEKLMSDAGIAPLATAHSSGSVNSLKSKAIEEEGDYTEATSALQDVDDLVEESSVLLDSPEQLSARIADLTRLAEMKWRYRVVDVGQSPRDEALRILTSAQGLMERLETSFMDKSMAGFVAGLHELSSSSFKADKKSSAMASTRNLVKHLAEKPSERGTDAGHRHHTPDIRLTKAHETSERQRFRTEWAVELSAILHGIGATRLIFDEIDEAAAEIEAKLSEARYNPPRLASPRLASPRLASPRLSAHPASTHLTCPHVPSPHLTSPPLALPRLLHRSELREAGNLHRELADTLNTLGMFHQKRRQFEQVHATPPHPLFTHPPCRRHPHAPTHLALAPHGTPPPHPVAGASLHLLVSGARPLRCVARAAAQAAHGRRRRQGQRASSRAVAHLIRQPRHQAGRRGRSGEHREWRLRRA
jgi:hypothetical protein